MVRWIRWHCPPDTWFEIRALAGWGWACYLSVTEIPHHTESSKVNVEETFVPLKPKRHSRGRSSQAISFPANTKHLYNMYATSAHCLRRWTKLYKCYTNVLCLLGLTTRPFISYDTCCLAEVPISGCVIMVIVWQQICILYKIRLIFRLILKEWNHNKWMYGCSILCQREQPYLHFNSNN